MGARETTSDGGAAGVTDGELLGQFVSGRSEAAFRELVERHQQMVFATCRRGLAGNHDLARDAAQSVFLVLAEKARSLKSYDDVGGWLFRTATLVVRDMNKAEWRRRMRETYAVQAAEAEAETVSPERAEEMKAHLNDAIAGLNPKMRDVVIMHHLENRTLADVAGRLACTVDAAQKRLQRAEQGLKNFFRGRGFVVSGAVVLSLLKSEAVITIGAEVAKACQAAAGGLTGAGVAAGSVIAAKGVLTKMTWWLQLKTLAAVLVTTGALAGTTELWKKVEEAQGKGLPRTAISNLTEIATISVNDKKWAEAIKAIAVKTALEGQVQGNKAEEKIVRLQEELAKASPEMKPVMTAILADWYWHYFQQNRWRFMQRTQTAGAPGADFTTWDLPRIMAEIDKQFEKALAYEKALRETPIETYSALLSTGTVSDAYRPTLYDFVAHEALSFYQAGEQAGSKAEDAFELEAASPVFAPAAEFMKWTPETTDDNSVTLKAVKLYQKLLAFHQGDKDKTAFADADLLRLNFGNNKAVGDEKSERYKAALKRFADEWADHEISARARWHLATALHGENELVEAHKVAKQGWNAFPNSIGGKQCWNLIQIIEAKQVSIQTERVWNEPWPSIRVEYKNVNKVFFRAIPWDFQQRLQGKGWNKEYIDHDERMAVLNAKAALEWSADLPATDDFKVREEFLQAPKDLKPGFYFVIASADPSFGEKNNQVSYVAVWVSDLALVMRPRNSDMVLEGFVLDAASGAPAAGAAVTAWQRRDSGAYSIMGKTETDSNGLFKFNGTERQSVLVIASRGEHSIASHDYSLYTYKHQEKPGRTVFFTDRSLYRPGQTIQYKGICISVDKEKDNYEVIPGQVLTVIMSDPNGKEVERHQHKANDYGSFSGSFTAPRDRLTGHMQIRVQEDSVRGYASVRVEEYKRPKFQVEVEAPKEGAKLNAEVKMKGKATAYTGSAIGGAKVKWRVTRGVEYPIWWRWCCWWWPPVRGEVQEIAHGMAKTETDGSFSLTFKAKPDLSVPEDQEPTFVYTVYADITDGTGETRSGQKMIRAGYTALAASMSAGDWLETGKPVTLTVKTATLDGEGQAAEGTIKIYALKQPEKVMRPTLLDSYDTYLRPLRYQPPRNDRAGAGKKTPERKPDPAEPNSWELGAVVKEVSFKTDASGTNAIPFELKAGIYRAMLDSKDRFGKPVTARLPLQVIDLKGNKFPVKVPNYVAAEKWRVEPGEKFLAVWGTGYDKGRAYIEVEHRKKIEKAFWTDAEKTQEIFVQAVEEEMRGGFTFRVTYVRENRAYLESRRVDVPWSNKKLTVKWERFVSKLMPDQKETWTAVVSGPDAGKTVAEMVAGLYDASLDQFMRHQWMSGFNVWRMDYSNLSSQFENRGLRANNIYFGWSVDQKPAELTYRAYPPEITANIYGYYGYGRRKGGGEMEALRFAGGMANAEEAAAAPPAPMAAMAKSPVADGAADRLGVSDKPQEAKRESGGGMGGGGEPAPDLSKVTARKNLNETAFFFPQLISDSNGLVKMEFTMPEALTEWKFMGFAHDKNLRSGFLQDKAVTAKDLMVEPNPPRFVREGDEIEFTVKVSNQSPTRQTGTVRLSMSDARTLAPVDKDLRSEISDLKFEIPAAESRTFSWRLKIPDGMGFLTYKAVGSTGKLSDGEEGFLPVLSKRILVTESITLPIRGAQTKNFEFKKLLESGKSKTIRHEAVTAQMVSQPAWYAVMALPYLMEYPHECTEATFNRLYANALARHIAKSDPKIRRIFDQWKGTPALDSPLEKNQDLKAVMLEETPWLRQGKAESEARRNVGVLFDQNRMDSEASATFRKLRDQQLGDGLWPWFPGGRGSEYITLYIMTGFGRVRHLGVKDVDMSCALRAVDRMDLWADESYRWILNHGTKDTNNLSSTVCLYLYGRSFFLKDRAINPKCKEAVDYWQDQGKKYWLSLRCRQSQAQLAVGLKRFGDLESPKAIMASIKEFAVTNDEMGMFWRDTEESWWWYRAPIETQAMVIEAFDEVVDDAASVEACRVWLLKQKQTQDWKTTKATADAVYALLLRGGNWLASDAIVEMSLGGVAVKPEKVEAGTGFYEHRFVRKEVEPKMGTVTVKKTDEGVSWGSLHWQYLEDIDKVTPHDGTPLKLVKKLFVKENTKKGPVLKPVSGVLAVGDELVVRVELRVDRAMEYVHLKDQRGSGTEPVNVLSQYRYQDGLAYYESTKDTASHFFIDYLPKGIYVFEYSVRIQHRGNYQSGMASIQCMYAPEFNSHSESFALEVK